MGVRSPGAKSVSAGTTQSAHRDRSHCEHGRLVAKAAAGPCQCKAPTEPPPIYRRCL